MAVDNELEFLEEYNRWAAEKRVAGVDISPGTFLVERVKDQAYDMLLSIQGIVEDWVEADDNAPLYMERIRQVLDR